jgi:hypothetical protein
MNVYMSVSCTVTQESSDVGSLSNLRQIRMASQVGLVRLGGLMLIAVCSTLDPVDCLSISRRPTEQSRAYNDSTSRGRLHEWTESPSTDNHITTYGLSAHHI